MKKQPLGPLLAAGFMCLIAFACPSFQVTEKEALAVVALINRGDAETLEKITALPFLLDGEIIALGGDAGVLWQGLAKAGITMSGARLVSLTDVREGDARRFSDSWEVGAFFKRYVPPRSKIAEIESDQGRFLLLLDGEAFGHARILGLHTRGLKGMKK